MTTVNVGIFKLPAGPANYHYFLRVYLLNGFAFTVQITWSNYVGMQSQGVEEIEPGD